MLSSSSQSGPRGAATRTLIGIVCLAGPLASPPTLPAQQEPPEAALPDTVAIPDSLPVAPDTVVAQRGGPDLAADTAGVEVITREAETVADTLRPGREPIRLGMTSVPLPWRFELRTTDRYDIEPRLRPGTTTSQWLAGRQQTQGDVLAARRDTLWWSSLGLQKLPPDFDLRRFLRTAELAAEADTALERMGRERRINILPDALERYADLLLQVDGSGQIASRWQSFAPCTIGIGQKCNSGAVPTVTPEFQIRAIARGTISDRIHVNVDFDQTREFNATNDLNVFYQGKADEILEFVELGQVTLPLPRSRFVSQGVPAGNFGVRSDARVGPFRLRGVLAQQDGDVLDRRVTLDVGGPEQGVLQDVETVLDDAAYQTGQFFFIVDPREMTGYPFIDVLNLQGGEVSDSLRPTSAIKLYRHVVSSGGQPPNVESGVIQARAVARRPATADPTLPDSVQFQGFFRPLVEGEDYIVHRSGLWAVIRARIQREEALAVTYIAERGDTVGDFDAEEIFRELTNTGQGELPRLVLLKDAETHRPGGVTWEREMHQIYRVSGSDDVEVGSIELVISQGPVESGPVVRVFGGEEYTFLEIFGLDDQPRDDLVDGVRIWRPAVAGEFAGTSVLSGSYLVLPALEPFKDPPPIKSDRVPELTGQPYPLNEGDRNLAIYDEPIDQTRLTSYRYRLNLRYRARSTGLQSSFSLGAIGIRKGSEKVLLDGRELAYGEDYTIDYDIGQLTLLRPGDLLSGSTSPDLVVRFEQKPLFQVGTKSILGLTGEYTLGSWGRVDLIGLIQKQGTVLNRPEIGLEPSGMGLGGLVTNFDFGSTALDNLANSLPGVSTSQKSRIQFNGELAGSNPTTNRLGTTWVDDFEGGDGLRVGLTTRSWRFGSLVSRADVGGGYLPAVPDITSRLAGVWQSQWDDNGIIQGSLLVSQIDPQLRVLNPGTRETVLWLSLTDPPAGGGNGWFSLTNVLSQTGIDLTTAEFLEFYASTLNDSDESLAIIIDIGTLSEDAYVPDSLGIPSGLGQLDQEADPLVGVWGNPDDTGLWATGCATEPNVSAWPLGDERAVCTNNNGLEDTEDLNRDNFLNTDERFVRYIVPLTAPSRYLNRPTGGEFRFNLYRVPLRLPDLEQGATGQDQQNVKHIRITLTSSKSALVLLSRMQFTGTRWLKRAGTGSVTGIIGETPGTAGQVGVGPVSTVDRGYVSPPGLSDQEADKTDEFRLTTGAINEQSLRLTFTDIPVGERVEVFRKFTERPRDFLPYRRMRAWALPFEGEWGVASSLRFYLRLGFDANNFYLYRTALGDSRGPIPTREDWLPEDYVDFTRLVELRTEAERRIIEAGSNLPGDTTFVLWDVDVFADGDSTLALVINDRSRAPNLAAIRELAIGVENVGDVPAGPGEVWIGDLRLDQASDDFGLAGAADVRVELADVLSLQGVYTSRNPFFRQLGASPNFQAGWNLGTRATLQMGKFLPGRWGVAMPIDVAHERASDNPYFLPQADVLAEDITELRRAGTSLTRWGLRLSKTTPSGSPVLRSTIDGMNLTYSHRSSRSTATQTENQGSGWQASLGWSRSVVDRSFPIIPGFLRAAVDLLPDFLSESLLLTNFKNLRLRWTPRQMSLRAALDKSTDERRRFETSVRRPEDAEVTPTVDRRETLTPGAGIELQPFTSLVYGVNFASARDLVDPGLRVSGGAARSVLEDESSTVLGLPVGWETSRNVTSRLSWRPELASWFDTDFNLTTGYRSIRNASYVQEVGTDTVLVRDMSLNRDMNLGLDVRPSDILTAFGVPDRLEAEGFTAAVRQVWDRLRPVRIDWSRSVNSSFDRRPLAPGLSEYLGLLGFQNMRVQGADTASAAGDNRRWSLAGGYRFPLDLQADLGYRWQESRTFSALAERGTRVVDWPDIRISWRDIPTPSGIQKTVRNVGLSLEWREQERTTLTQTGQDQGNEQTVRSIGVLLVFSNGFNLSYDYDNTLTRRTDATGFSESTRGSHTVRATGSVTAPSALSFIRQPLRVSADYSRNGNLDCRDLGGGGFGGDPRSGSESCIAHVDQTTQNASFTLDSDFTGYSIGVQFSWTQRGSGVGQRQTSNQYNFNIFGRFYFRSDQGSP